MVINPIVGVYIPIIRIPIKGGMTIPNTTSLDPPWLKWTWNDLKIVFHIFWMTMAVPPKDKFTQAILLIKSGKI